MNYTKKIIKFVNIIIPKDKHLMIFSSHPDFSDNSKTVLDAIKLDKRFSNYRLAWITYEERTKEFEGVECYYKKTLKALWMYLRAKYVFSTHGLYSGTLVSNQIHIGLWHGMPTKKIKSLLNDIKIDREFTFTLASSPMYQDIMSRCFQMPKENVFILGVPRNDKLFHKDDTLQKLGITNDYKTICWLPTFRNHRENSKEEGATYEYAIPYINSENVFEIDNLLERKKIKLIVKYHKVQRTDDRLFPSTKNIFFMTADECARINIDLYKMLACSDALLTDYSSVFIDYLSIDRPIGFTLDDFEKFSEDRGFVFNPPLDYMAGMKIMSLHDLKKFISDVSEDVDNFKKDREEVRKYLNIFKDDKNTERVINFIYNRYCSNI